MKRTGFKPRVPHREARDPDRVRSMPTVTPGAFRAPEPVASVHAAQVAKAAPVRSEAYRRLVASLPCIACGIQGYSQAAHLPPEAKGMKQVDLAALVGVHPGAIWNYENGKSNYEKTRFITMWRCYCVLAMEVASIRSSRRNRVAVFRPGG